MIAAGSSVLVTGGAGFIGSALIDRLLAMDGVAVSCVDTLTYAADENRLRSHIARGLDFHQVDVADAEAVERVFAQTQPDLVFHLAAESHVDRSIEGPAPFIHTNVVGTSTMLESARTAWTRMEPERSGRFRFVHVSTDEVFGSAGEDGWFDTETPYSPRSPYSASKAGADHLARAWHETYGLPVVVTNCSNNYGPYQFPEKLIPHMVIRALTDRSLPVYGDGGQQRDWLHVEDHVSALIAAGARGIAGDTYLIGARNPLTNLELVERICDRLDDLAPGTTSHRERIEFVTDRPGHDRRYAIDPSHAERVLGWIPAIPFEDGLDMTIAWYVQHRDWWTSILERGYDAGRRGLKS